MDTNTSARLSLWSATPTPLTLDLSVDLPSVARMVDHHLNLGIDGLLLGGSCGEGPWMPLDDLALLVRTTSRAAQGRICISAQVTDNSVRRMLNGIDLVANAGAEIAVVASPYFLMNINPDRLVSMYQELIRRSSLPIGFYDRGKKYAVYPVDTERLAEIYAEPNLVMVKDSSGSPERRDAALNAKAQRPELKLLNGDEFNCCEYIEAGYDGLLLGGGIFNGHIARKLMDAARSGDAAHARKLQERMSELMFRVYGGPKIECWLAGLKYLLTRMDIFPGTANSLGYTLTDSCKAAIDEILDGPDQDGYRADLLVDAFQGHSSR